MADQTGQLYKLSYQMDEMETGSMNQLQLKIRSQQRQNLKSIIMDHLV